MVLFLEKKRNQNKSEDTLVSFEETSSSPGLFILKEDVLSESNCSDVSEDVILDESILAENINNSTN